MANLSVYCNSSENLIQGHLSAAKLVTSTMNKETSEDGFDLNVLGMLFVDYLHGTIWLDVSSFAIGLFAPLVNPACQYCRDKKCEKAPHTTGHSYQYVFTILYHFTLTFGLLSIGTFQPPFSTEGQVKLAKFILAAAIYLPAILLSAYLSVRLMKGMGVGRRLLALLVGTSFLSSIFRITFFLLCHATVLPTIFVMLMLNLVWNPFCYLLSYVWCIFIWAIWEIFSFIFFCLSCMFKLALGRLVWDIMRLLHTDISIPQVSKMSL